MTARPSRCEALLMQSLLVFKAAHHRAPPEQPVFSARPRCRIVVDLPVTTPAHQGRLRCRRQLGVRSPSQAMLPPMGIPTATPPKNRATPGGETHCRENPEQPNQAGDRREHNKENSGSHPLPVSRTAAGCEEQQGQNGFAHSHNGPAPQWLGEIVTNVTPLAKRAGPDADAR